MVIKNFDPKIDLKLIKNVVNGWKFERVGNRGVDDKLFIFSCDAGDEAVIDSCIVEIQFKLCQETKGALYEYLMRAKYKDDNGHTYNYCHKFAKCSYTLEKIISLVLTWASHKMYLLTDREYSDMMEEIYNNFNNIDRSKLIAIKESKQTNTKSTKLLEELSYMKLHEEFKLYESLWESGETTSTTNLPKTLQNKRGSNTPFSTNIGSELKKKVCKLLIKRGDKATAEKVWKYDLIASKDISEIDLDHNTATIKIPAMHGYTYSKLVDAIIEAFKNTSIKINEGINATEEETKALIDALDDAMTSTNFGDNFNICITSRFENNALSICKQWAQHNGVQVVVIDGKTTDVSLIDEELAKMVKPNTVLFIDNYSRTTSKVRVKLFTIANERTYNQLFTVANCPHAAESTLTHADFRVFEMIISLGTEDKLTEAVTKTASEIICRYEDNVADHIVELEHEKAFADAEWFEDEWYILEDVKVNPDYYILVMDRPVESLQDAEAIINYAFGFINNTDEAFSEGGIVQDEGSNELYVEAWVVE